MSTSLISNHIAHADFARCSLSFWLHLRGEREGGGEGRGGEGRGVGSAEIGLVFVARFIKPLT